MSTASLPLRDVHLPPAPGAWPPAPGWSLLLAALCVLLALLLWHFWKRRRQQRRWRQLFDDALREAATPVAQLAAASGLLRRAARRARADVVQLQDEDWLRFLDGGKRDDFSQGAGRLLLDGGYRREIDAAAAAQACTLARARFLELMGRRR